MKQLGRPKGPKNSQKEAFNMRLRPLVLRKIKEEAKKFDRPKTYFVEKLIEKQYGI